MKHFITILIIFSCLAISCETPKDSAKSDSENNKPEVSGFIVPSFTLYQMEVVNNTGSN